MSLVGSRTQFTKSEEEMFARFEHVTLLSPRSSLINALSDDLERVYRELENFHQDLGFVDLVVGVSALSKRSLPPASLVTLVSRVYTMNAYSQKSIEELFSRCTKQENPNELAAFLEHFFFMDDRDCDSAFISDTISRLGPLIATSTTPESILAHLEPLFNSRHVQTHQHLSILIALFYLTSKNRDTFFNEHEVAKKSECAEFIIKATSSRRKLFEAYLVLSKPATWSSRCCELLLTHMPERVSEQFCLDIAAVDSRVVVKWLDEQQAISLSFIVKLMQQLASRLDSNPSIFTKLESLSWEQNVSQLHPESFYKQFIQDIQAITADDFFINKSIDTILRGLKQLKEEFDPLITRLADGDRKEYLKTRLIETKAQALGIVFLLASSAKNPRLTANLYSVRLLNLRLTDRDQEPMVVCDKSTIGFKALGFHF